MFGGLSEYRFLKLILSYFSIDDSGAGFNIKGKISASNFKTNIKERHETSQFVSKPVLKLSLADINLSEDKMELLSQIIADINSRTGKNFDNEVAVKAMLQIKDIMMKSDSLKASAQNNTAKDFEFTYFDNIDDALIEGLEQNKDFFTLLLNNDDIKKQVLGIFSDEIYMSLRGGANEEKHLPMAAEPVTEYNKYRDKKKAALSADFFCCFYGKTMKISLPLWHIKISNNNYGCIKTHTRPHQPRPARPCADLQGTANDNRDG